MTASIKPDKHEMTPRSTFTHIGNWTLGDTLGRGAYAHVRLATHISGRKAACKILPALHQDPAKPVTWDQTVDAIEAHKEVVLLKALSGIKLNGVVELEGIVERDGWTYMFSTLHSHSAAQEHEPWERDRLINFFRQLCLTIYSLHQLNISHEDIKRSNVLVGTDSCPSLIDFGFSHFAAHGQAMRSAGGTLDYSSPEKVQDCSYNGPVTDVWSLVILLTKMLAVPHPFIDIDTDTESSAKAKIVRATPEYHFNRHHLGRGGAASLILQMLEPDPKKRITLIDVLEHPYLMPSRIDPPTFVLPPLKLSSKIRKSIPANVILDVCFLAYLNKELFLCETLWLIEHRIFGPEPCWEKRWATMLYQWKEREEMDWEDIAVAPKRFIAAPARPRAPATTGPFGPAQQRTALKEIRLDSKLNIDHLIDQIPTTKAKHVHEASSTVDPKKVARTNEEPKLLRKMPILPRGIGLAKKPPIKVSSPKRSPSQAKLGENILLADNPEKKYGKVTQDRLRRVGTVSQLRPVQRPTRTVSSLMSTGSSNIAYPVIEPGQERPSRIENTLLGDSVPSHNTTQPVNGMTELALGIKRVIPTGPPRRSTRIAEKGTANKGLR